MAQICFEGRSFESAPGETVLECLQRHGQRVDSFCRSGVCQSCMLRATRGNPPPVSQVGLKEAWKRHGYFLACVCQADEDLDVGRCDESKTYPSRVLEVTRLSPSVLRVALEHPPEFRFDAGQFIQVVRPSDGLMRPYSIASLPSSGHLELHVALLPEGQMSGWLAQALGQTVNVRGPFGECVYLPNEAERPLLLAGTGTGLAPLLGVLRAAHAAGHKASVRLIHGAVNLSGLYGWAELCHLQAQMTGLQVTGSVLASDGELPAHVSAESASVEQKPLDELALSSRVNWGEQRVYLCGHPDLVRTLRKKMFLAGTPLQRIHADPFLPPKNAI